MYHDPILKKDGWVIQPIEKLPGGGDVHDTFRIDPSGNISGGHTTVRLPDGNAKPIQW